MTKIAAIDVGSNAIRCTIADVDSSSHYSIVEKLRFPLRLGLDVFQTGEVSASKISDILEVFNNIKSLIDHYQVQEVKAVATSALRDAKNSKTIINQIHEKYSIKLNLISGHEEARLLFEIIAHELPILTGNVLLIDIGGGSTEIVLVTNGEIEIIESFDVGTIRLLADQKNDLTKLIDFIKKQTSSKKFKVIGTGGNLRRIGKLRKKIFDRKDVTIIHKDEVVKMYNHLMSFSALQLMKKYDLKHDRAEVIVPALLIFNSILNDIDVDIINLPKLGLSDALLLELSSANIQQ